MFKIGEFAQIAQVSARQLRHYDQLGLLQPVSTDPATGYRFYSIRQLGRLNCILALKELGLTLDQIGPLLENRISPEELRGMLTMKRAQVEQTLREEEIRLRHIQSRIEQIDGTGALKDYDVVVKAVPAAPFLSLRAQCDGMDEAVRLVGSVVAEGARQLRPGLIDKLVVVSRNDFEQEKLDLEIGFTLTRPTNQAVRVGGGILQSGELPAIPTMATIVRSGPVHTSHQAFGALGGWMEVHGYEVAGPYRELFLELPGGPLDSDDALIEIQFPVRQAA
jgi:DNA-binding transcriptional MerR regulator